MYQDPGIRRAAFGMVLMAGLMATSPTLASPRVVASIKPLQSLVAAVMRELGTAGLIIKSQASPHTYTLKPSDAESLQQAEIIFWIGPEMENFMVKPLASLGEGAKIVAVMEQPAIQKLPVRRGKGFDHHEHGSEVRGDHEAFDAHIWLDPENAKRILDVIAQTLAESDPAQATAYVNNAITAKAEIDKLDAELRSKLAPAKNVGFIVFHDAYQYFERHYGLAASGAISINPENPPGAKGIAALQHRVKGGDISCVFAEPQFDNKLATLITEGTPAKLSTLDPLGVNLEEGRSLYGKLMRELADSFASCVGP